MPNANAPGSWRGPQSASVVPISEIGPEFREQMKRHLLDLDARDRYLRFGYLASDEQISRYIDSIHFERDQIYAIFNRALHIIALAHLAFAPPASADAPATGVAAPAAEFGVSVSKKARGRGYGKRLFERAAVHAVNRGVDTLCIYALSENGTMLHIARSAGAVIESEGSESAAYVHLPKATFSSQMEELVAGQVGTMDFWLKSGAAALHGLLSPRADWRPQRTRKPARRKAPDTSET